MYAFYGSKNFQNIEALENPNHINGDQESAAFGFSITSAGDINRDGFQDILVGSPYYNDGVGAVFLYLGSEDGLQSTYSQKITPQMLNVKLDNIKTFGWSLSSGKDMDSNLYPDVAIGAYKSGHVVYLRSTAIIDVIPEFVFSSTKINPKNATVETPGGDKKVAGTMLKICLLYKGNKTNVNIQINLKVSLDTSLESNRVYFDYYSPKSHWDTSLNVDLSDKTTSICSPQKSVYLHDRIEDVRPVEVSVSAKLAEISESFDDRKVLNQKVIRETKASIAIITKCNEKTGKCKVDLNLSIPDYKYEKSDKYPAVVYNKVNYVYPRFVIRNNYKGSYNYTYNAIVDIKLPVHLEYEEVRSSNVGEKVSCVSMSDLLKCKVPSVGPLNEPSKSEQEFVLKLKLVNVSAPIDQVIKATVKPSEPSVEENSDDNSGELVIAIKELADLVIRGGATQAKIAFNNKYTLLNNIIASKEIDIK